MLNYFIYQRPLGEAIAMPRYHHVFSKDKIILEEGKFSHSLPSKLKARRHSVSTGKNPCKVNAIAMEKGQLLGMSDPRGEGSSIGE